MVGEPGAAPVVEGDLDQVHPARSAAGEAGGRAPQAGERVGRQAHARAEARSRTAGLDLDHDQGLALREDEVELGPARLHSSRQEAPAARTQGALDQPLAGLGEARIAGREQAQREPRSAAREQPARAADQTLLGSAFSSSTGSLPASITFWIAAREKRRRTLSATCSTTTSAVVVTTVP